MQLATHRANPVSVIAATILEVTEKPNGNLMLRLSDGRNYDADTSMTVRHYPVVGDYLVTQADGYEYLNPKDVFERKYAPTTAAAPSSDAALDREIVAKGLTAPRVTPADIEANIANEHYFTAGQGIDGEIAARSSSVPYCYAKSLDLLTFCVLVLRNGFTVAGVSACASQENFDAELGRKIARENAINKVWPLMGYALKQQLHEAATKTAGEAAAQAARPTQNCVFRYCPDEADCRANGCSMGAAPDAVGHQPV